MSRRSSNIFVFDELLIGSAAVAVGAKAARALRERHRKQLEKALWHVDEAIDRHEAHLSGEEPTSDRSQEALMSDLEKAKKALEGALRSEKKEEKRKKSR